MPMNFAYCSMAASVDFCRRRTSSNRAHPGSAFPIIPTVCVPVGFMGNLPIHTWPTLTSDNHVRTVTFPNHAGSTLGSDNDLDRDRRRVSGKAYLVRTLM